MATIANILSRINLIVTDAKSKATLVRPVLSDILAVATNFFADNANPGVNNDESQNFRPGSLGYNTFSKRTFVCISATDGAANWQLISEDKGVQVVTMVNAATTALAVDTAVARFNGSVSDYTINLPATPYTGKSVSLFFGGPVASDLSILNSAGDGVFGDVAAANLSLTFTCTDGAANTWALTSYSQP